jgi:amidohydrolase
MNKFENIIHRAKELQQKIVDYRRDFHQHPELAFHEFDTARKVELVLKSLGIETRMLVNDTGVCGYLKGLKPGKTIALRADMDALPIQEEADVPYKSQNAGVMHACGHDAHTAMLLGAATILSEWRRELTGNVVFIFQPAEEIGEGAKKMIEEGVLQGVDGIFGLHVAYFLDVGTLGYRLGPLLAAGDFFEVTIKGKGAHGSTPHLSKDPIMIAANVIAVLQTVVSREVDPLESAVVSICKIEGGKAYNVIPDSVTFGGAIRSHNPELREYLLKRLREILHGVVTAMQGDYEFNLMSKFPVTINDDEMTLFVATLIKEILGEDKVFQVKARMGSEDFSYYLQKIPGTFVYIGIANRKKGIIYPGHNPKFDIDEDVLSVGAAINASVALEYLFKKGRSS